MFIRRSHDTKRMCLLRTLTVHGHALAGDEGFLGTPKVH